MNLCKLGFHSWVYIRDGKSRWRPAPTIPHFSNAWNLLCLIGCTAVRRQVFRKSRFSL